MDIFANQIILWARDGKVTRRTIVVRGTLNQMDGITKGIQATAIGYGTFTVLRWGECRRHNKGTTRRINAFQLLMLGTPTWVSESVIENALHVQRDIYASSTIKMYHIKYSHDFIPPTRKLNSFKYSPKAYDNSSVDIEVNEKKICSSPTLPSLSAFHSFTPQTIATLPSFKTYCNDDMENKRDIQLPKLNDLKVI
ncbi:Uncharacterized protein QTN25_003052 [Entamoeba marina]